MMALLMKQSLVHSLMQRQLATHPQDHSRCYRFTLAWGPSMQAPPLNGNLAALSRLSRLSRFTVGAHAGPGVGALGAVTGDAPVMAPAAAADREAAAVSAACAQETRSH